ncbi:MAG: hypothetical protein A2033_01570 [Bacteroidetes bacterium GWA2_31_9]|nr:MAG: hypothetical protein A2033_01570 [Bacteroidetes bacterium GWA2_31_9]
MNTLDKIKNKKSDNIVDKLIFEKGLKIKTIFIVSDLDLMIIVLNNKKILNIQLTDYPKLKNANKNQLNNWKLISGGIGIEWEDLDEDLSLKGFIETYAYQTAIQSINQNEYLFT